MRIRWKLFWLLVALFTPALLVTSWQAVFEAERFGRSLARDAAGSLTRQAEDDLAQLTELYAENVTDSRNLLQLALSLLVYEAEALVSGRSGEASSPMLSPRVFDQGSPEAGPLSPSPFEDKDGRPMAVSYSRMVCLSATPPGQAAPIEDLNTLTGLLPIFRILFQDHAKLMLWTYVGLDSGAYCAYPGHGGYPEGYDPRVRPWYLAAMEQNGPAWSASVDAITRRLLFTLSEPIHGPDGKPVGVGAIDVPVTALLPESDLARRFGPEAETILTTADRDKANGLLILARRKGLETGLDWKTPISLEPLSSGDPAGLAAMIADLNAGRSGVRRMTRDGQDCLWAYKSLAPGGAALILSAPLSAVTSQADRAEAAILSRAETMLAQTVLFTLGVTALLFLAAFLAARAVTRPLARLSEAAGRLASGEAEVAVPALARDELGDLARSFNAMAPKLAERLRLKQDMALAMEVQHQLLPQSPPCLPGLDMAGASFFCDDTGGDYYDFLRIDDDAGHCDILLGDVTGHGISAALFMATGRALLRGRLDHEATSAEVLTLVNRLLCQDTILTGRFITMFYLRLEDGGLAPGGALRWVRAGHDPALVFDPATGDFEELKGTGIPLGVEPSWEYAEYVRQGLLPGQVLVMATDGVWEARSPSDEMFGKERFLEVIRRNADKSAQGLIEAVFAAVSGFQEHHDRDDDITLVVVKALA